MNNPPSTEQTAPGIRPTLSHETVQAVLEIEARLLAHHAFIRQIEALAATVLSLNLDLHVSTEPNEREEAVRVGWLLGLLHDLTKRLAADGENLATYQLILACAKRRGELQAGGQS